jgi:glycosyltransferase involved in cell wall biosynthesis
MLYIFPINVFNSFVSDLCEVLKSNGVESENIVSKDLLRILVRKTKNSTIVFNWIENYLVVNGHFSIVRYIKLSAVIILLRGRGYRLIHVQHNEYPHLLDLVEKVRFDKFYKIFKYFFSKTQKLYDAHTNEIVLHPLPNGSSASYSGGTEFDLLIFGSIMRYKSIETVLQALKDSGSNLKICIAGDDPDPEYLRQLKAIGYGYVSILPSRISEDSLIRLINSSRVVGTFNRFGSSYVSGSVFKALSVGVPVIALTSGYLEAMLLKKPHLPIRLIDSMAELEEAVRSFIVRPSQAEYFDSASVFESWNSLIYD